MSMKRISIAIVAVMAISAIAAASSSAAVKTVRAEWYTGASPGTTLPGGTSLTVKGTLVEHPTIGKKATLLTTIGGLPIDITAEEGECVECKISNKEVTSKAGAIAYGEGKLRFKKATVMEPAGCSIKGESGVTGEVTTKLLILHADWMDTTEANQKAFIQFIPAAGATTTFGQFSLSGGECEAISGAKNVFGTLFAETVNNTGVFANSQGLVFSPAVQSTAGAALNVGGQTANLTGTTSLSAGGGATFALKP
jgi:hypothetical protein